MITIAMTAWPKTDHRIACLASTLASLDGLIGKYERLISCESKDVTATRRAAVERLGARVVWRDAKPNLGTHLNEVMRCISTSHVLYVQDDTPLLKKYAGTVDAYLGAEVIDRTGAVFVRYWHNSKVLTTGDEVLEGNDRFKWINVDATRYVYSDRPFLARADYLGASGPYTDGGANGRGHEDAMNETMKSLNLGYMVRSVPCFGHIGRESVFVPNKIWTAIDTIGDV